MPWHKTAPVNERLKFVAAWYESELTMTELCAKFGISRKTGYKTLERYHADGPEGLLDRSRAPKRHPNQTPAAIEVAILKGSGGSIRPGARRRSSTSWVASGRRMTCLHGARWTRS
jgi:hypothetical protein